MIAITNKNMRQKLTKIILATVIFLGTLLPALPASAAGASIYLVANKSTVASGGTLIVAVYMNGGGSPINAVESDLSYPAAKLQYVGLSYSGSAFSINTPSNGGGNGAVSIQNGSVSPVSGTGLVATVTFRALVGAGSAAIGVSGSSSLVNANDNSAVAYGPAGVNVNFGAPAASAAPAAAAPATPAAPKDTTPPVITDIKLKNITPFSAVITWTTNEAADSTVDYGLDASYGLSASSAGLTTAHTVTLNSAFLVPETLLHYRVQSTDGSGNVATGSDQSFQLPGVPVTIVVRGADGQPQAGAIVTLDSATGTTDSKGTVILASGLGNKKITTTYQGVTIQKPITVSRTAKPLPPYQLDLAKQPLNPWMLTSIGLVVVVLTLLGIDAVLFGSRLFARVTGLRFLPKDHQLQPPEPQASEPPVDASKTVAELMGDVPFPEVTALPLADVPSSASSVIQIPISDVARPELKPQDVASLPTAPTIASRLKKPSAHKPRSRTPKSKLA
jgi:hypothetical protein